MVVYFARPGHFQPIGRMLSTHHLSDWINQTFMGRHASIGEDCALTNLVLGCGFRVVYQRKAVVLTNVSITYPALRKILNRTHMKKQFPTKTMLAQTATTFYSATLTD